MVTPEVLQYIKSQLQSGKTPDDIRSHLLGSGWHSSDIESAFQTIQPNSIPSAASQAVSSAPVTSKGFPIMIIVIILVVLSLGVGGYFVLASIKKTVISAGNFEVQIHGDLEPSGTKVTISVSDLSSVTPTKVPTMIPTSIVSSSAYPTLIQTRTSQGWQKATFSPSPGGHGIPFIFYYPSSLNGQRGDQQSPTTSIDTISERVTLDTMTSFDQMIQLSSLGFEDFETLVKEATPFTKEQQTVVDFTTASGLSGKKITASGALFNNAVKFDSILLHTGKQSDMKKEIVIRVSGTYEYAGGKGKGTYTGTSDIIDQIAQTVSL